MYRSVYIYTNIFKYSYTYTYTYIYINIYVYIYIYSALPKKEEVKGSMFFLHVHTHYTHTATHFNTIPHTLQPLGLRRRRLRRSWLFSCTHTPHTGVLQRVAACCSVCQRRRSFRGSWRFTCICAHHTHTTHTCKAHEQGSGFDFSMAKTHMVIGIVARIHVMS